MQFDKQRANRYEAILQPASVRPLTPEELEFVKAYCRSYFQLLELLRDEETTIEQLQGRARSNDGQSTPANESAAGQQGQQNHE